MLKVDQIESKSNNHADIRLNNNPEQKLGIVKKFLLYLKSFLPFFLSHHPECANFKEHTIKCGKVKLCIGCFVGYPTAVVALFLIRISFLRILFSTHLSFMLSLLFIGSFFLSPLNLTKYKKIKIVQKILIGFGAAMLFNWILERPSSNSTNLRTAFITFYILLMGLNLYHVYGILGSCYKCATPFNWGKCSGFCSIRDRMERNNLVNFLLKFENFSYRILEKRIEKKNKSLEKNLETSIK